MDESALPPAGHEPTDVSGRFIVGAVLLVVGFLACVTVGVLLGFPVALRDKTMPTPLPVFPAPDLQAAPRTDMQRFRAAKLAALNGAGWTDEAHGIAHIPIDDAMRLVAHEGIAGWPAATR